MGTDWGKEAEGSPKLSEGYHRAEIAKVVRTKKDGEELKNRDGLPYMLVVVNDRDGAEASSSFTIDKAKKFFLARLLVACDATESFASYDMEDFEDEDVAKKLVGLRLWVRVTHSGQYANFEAIPASEVPPDVIQAAKSKHKTGTSKAEVIKQNAPVAPDGEDVDEDDIPF